MPEIGIMSERNQVAIRPLPAEKRILHRVRGHFRLVGDAKPP